MAEYNADGTTTFVPGESNGRAVTNGTKAGAESAGVAPQHVTPPHAPASHAHK